MRKLLYYLLVALPDSGMYAQCPTIFNCPQGSPVICDQSGNDAFLWKDPPYTWSQVLDTTDLYEAAADFNIKILPCAGGGNVHISYALLLDLDNDNLRETAVQSANLPPPGLVYANNAFSPGYAGGEPVEFDKRSVPDSLKFRFALEITPSWDTLVARLCWQTGDQFVSPRLPEGRHYLIWRVEQDGIVKYCEHSFRIIDCQPPTLECAPVWSVSLESNGSVSLHLNDILPDAVDNTTPFALMEFSMRKAGGGPGFPLDSAGNAISTLTYNCEELDTQIVEIWAKDRPGNVGQCETILTVTDDDGVCEEPPMLCARPFWSTGDVVKPVTYKILWVDTTQQLITQTLPLLPGGCGVLNILPPASTFSLVAECDTNPLNGVSTFDLLLISRHILGIQPFDAPWKWIAADVNKNGSITTFDLVELRKLILGIYNKLPANTSWRFFPTDCVFSANPFSDYCPPKYTFVTMPLWNYPAEITFNALKTGDVNGTANPVSYDPFEVELRGNPATLQLPDLTFEAGATYEIPIMSKDAGAWLGFQFGLQFAPDVIDIEAIKPGLLKGLDDNAFAQSMPGMLNVSWYSPTTQVVMPDDILMTLRVKALQSGQLSEAVQFHQDRLLAEVYPADEAIRPLQIQFANNEISTGATAIFPPQPNPTSQGVIIPLRLVQTGMVSMEVCDFSGKIIFQKEVLLESGNRMLEIPASALPSTGMYVWRLRTGTTLCSGKIARL